MKRKCAVLAIATIVAVATIAANSPRVASGDPLIRPSVTFEGLAALVRSEAFDRGAVVLVDPTRSTLQSHLPAHHAMLTIPMSAVKSGTPDGFADAEQRVGVWELANASVSFETSATGPLRPMRTAANVTHPRTAEEWRDVKWLINMDAVAGSSEIRSSLMTAADLRGSGLNARVALGAGTIEATVPSEPYSQSEVRFLPLHGLTNGRPFQQAGTRRLLYTPDAARSFAIVLQPSNGGAPRKIELRPTAERITINISNHTTMDTLTNGEMPQRAVHFLSYFDLLAKPVTTALVPSSLVPYPSTTTAASPGFFCDGSWFPSFTSSFEEE